jgi:hypothetical protein
MVDLERSIPPERVVYVASSVVVGFVMAGEK